MSERIVTVGGPDPTRPLSEFDRNIAGTKFYVGPNATGVGDDGRSGRSKESSLATLAYALTLATASKNDIIYLLPGHAETVTTSIDISKIGVRVVGLGSGKLAPALTCNAAIDCITVTAADVVIENVYFPASTLTGVTARINVAAANCLIRDCLFLVGEFDLETITVAAGGDDLTITDCQFISNDAGEGDAAIEIEAAGVDGLKVIDCHFDGYDDTQAWDTGAINSGAAHTRCLIKNNTSLYGAGIIFSAAATGMIIGNKCSEGTIGAMIDPGSCMCIENYESDAIDESGSLFPQATPIGGGIATDVAAVLVDTGTTIPSLHEVPVADAGTNVYMRDVVGIKTDAAVGAATTDKSLMGYVKGILTDTAVIGALGGGLTDLGGMSAAMKLEVNAEVDTAMNTAVPDSPTVKSLNDIMSKAAGSNNYDCATDSLEAIADALSAVDGFHDVPTADAGTNLYMRDVVGIKTDAAVGTVEVDKSLMGYAKGIVTDTGITIPATLAALPQCVVKADGAYLSGLDPLFTVSGGPVRCKIVGLVTTAQSGGAVSCRLQHITTTPAATVELNAGAVVCTDDAAGTFYYNVGAASTFTPSTGLGFLLADPVSLEETEFLLAPGVVQCLCTAAFAGVIAWYMTYEPLSPLSVVTAAV